jgi:hypothetical protein
MLGLARMERIDFDGDSISRQIATYSNGARIWINRGESDWEAEGLVLPQWGYLIQGPSNYRQYRARKGDQVVEAVSGPDYSYYGAERSYDFGAVATNGAVAVRTPSASRVIVYELKKPAGSVVLRLGQLPGTRASQKALRAWALMTRGRRLELLFPDLQQKGSEVQFSTTEMATTVGYEIELSTP